MSLAREWERREGGEWDFKSGSDWMQPSGIFHKDIFNDRNKFLFTFQAIFYPSPRPECVMR